MRQWFNESQRPAKTPCNQLHHSDSKELLALRLEESQAKLPPHRGVHRLLGEETCLSQATQRTCDQTQTVSAWILPQFQIKKHLGRYTW